MKITAQLKRPFLIIAVCLLAPCFSGCEKPLKNLDDRLEMVKVMQFPVDIRAEIVLPPDKQNAKFKSGYEDFAKMLENSASCISAAKQAFGRIFREVDVSGKILNPQFTIKIDYDVQADFYTVYFRAAIDCNITYADGEPIAAYKSRAKETGLMVDQSVIDKTYLKAMEDIVMQMIDDPNMNIAIVRALNNAKTK
jgi:hypothetical protein